MIIVSHSTKNGQLAEVKSEDVVVNTAEDGLQLLGDLYYQQFDAIILYAQNIAPEFFDLKTGIAGEILQKFSNYRMKLAIVGDFSSLTSKSFRDFVSESNKTRHVVFVVNTEEALQLLAN